MRNRSSAYFQLTFQTTISADKALAAVIQTELYYSTNSFKSYLRCPDDDWIA